MLPYIEDTIENLLLSENAKEAKILLAQARFSIEKLELIGDIILIFEVGTFDTLINTIDEQLGVL